MLKIYRCALGSADSESEDSNELADFEQTFKVTTGMVREFHGSPRASAVLRVGFLRLKGKTDMVGRRRPILIDNKSASRWAVSDNCAE